MERNTTNDLILLHVLKSRIIQTTLHRFMKMNTYPKFYPNLIKTPVKIEKNMFNINKYIK